jgi:hypothetical protein
MVPKAPSSEEEKIMYDCSKEVLGYHDDEVRLPHSERDEMRKRRNTNRDRVKAGLEKNKNPKPIEFKPQGSYAMKTMVQHPEKDYDIDDGIYFKKEDLVDKSGAEMSALQARQMVRDAIDDGSFKKAPKVRQNCVRVYYEAGYHVDMPVYRRVVTKDLLGQEQEHFELASSDWKRSDARDVTKWFEGECDRLSADKYDGGQVRRVTREIKKYSQSRESWKSQIGSGFMITKLVTECYHPDGAREDKSLYYTMRNIRDRLDKDLVVKHPVTPDDTITKGDNDPKARFLKDKLSEALTWLDVLFTPECTQEDAYKAWDKVFNTKYFTNKLPKEEEKEASRGQSPDIITSGMVRDWGGQASREPVRKEGGGRYA